MPDPFVIQPRVASATVERALPPRAAVTPDAAMTIPVQPPSAAAAYRAHPALAAISAYLDDPLVTDVFVNGETGLFVDRGSGAVAVTGWRAAEADVRALAVALVGLGGRHIDHASPCVDVRLDDGVRVHAVLPPVAADGTAISIRVPRLGLVTLALLEQRGMLDAQARIELETAVVRRRNVLVTGAAGAGKTTLLAALLAAAPHSERIVTIEDVAELRIDHPHHVRLEARQANLEGAGAVGLPRLVREALRMRPDRLVVGECRGEEVRELLTALNTGHDGGAGTLHANSLDDVAARLEALGALAGLDDAPLARQVVSAIDLVVHVARGADGIRRLAGVGRPILGASGRLAIEEIRWQ
jgi:pilus assembly protein CpaF